jgi:hypothetical protein
VPELLEACKFAYAVLDGYEPPVEMGLINGRGDFSFFKQFTNSMLFKPITASVIIVHLTGHNTNISRYGWTHPTVTNTYFKAIFTLTTTVTSETFVTAHMLPPRPSWGIFSAF